MIVYLDTHIVAWLIDGESRRLSPAAARAVERNDLLISAVSILELELLYEIGRIKKTASSILTAMAAEIGLRVCDLPFRSVAEHALSEKWTSDPFDRLIVANAKAAGAPLVTKDDRIRAHYSRAIW